MKFLAVHPSGLIVTKVYLRLEPIGLALIAQVVRRAGHEVKLIDLQVEKQREFARQVNEWQPDVIAFSCNYLANIPEVVDLAKFVKATLPDCFVLVGGHSASFTAEEMFEHAQGSIDCILIGEGEATVLMLMDAIQHDRKAISHVPGVVSEQGCGPPPIFVDSLDELSPARDLLRYKRRYFISDLEPAASIEFSRGCPWDCSFCSAWTFYGRSYRLKSPEAAVDHLQQIKGRGVFIVDDVAFIQESHGLELGEAIARKGIKKEYFLETRSDVLLRNKEVFKFWKDIGLVYMFLGVEAIDAEGLQKFRKRISLDKNMEALEFARSLGIAVAINLIVDPDWDHERFEVIRKWTDEIPEIASLSVLTPYPGTENWFTESRKLISRDYRLFDIQHNVLETKLPLAEFYKELVATQANVYNKYLSLEHIPQFLPYMFGKLLRGQTNFLKLLLNFKSVYDPMNLLAHHEMPVKYELRLPPEPVEKVDPQNLYIHHVHGHDNRALDPSSEKFVEETRMGVTQ